MEVIIHLVLCVHEIAEDELLDAVADGVYATYGSPVSRIALITNLCITALYIIHIIQDIIIRRFSFTTPVLYYILTFISFDVMVISRYILNLSIIKEPIVRS